MHKSKISFFFLGVTETVKRWKGRGGKRRDRKGEGGRMGRGLALSCEMLRQC